jgi:hypothetical protein
MIERLPLETQTLYAEFLAQLLATTAHRSIGQAPGCFTTKTVKGDTYLYFQYSDPGGAARQAYIGKKTVALDKVVRRFQQERHDAEQDLTQLRRLCALLRVGGASPTDSAPARILKAFADAGLFQLGGVLVGTHAFAVIGNVLGVRWRGTHLKTQDIDIAGDPNLAIALPELHADVPQVLDALQMGFLPVPPLNRKHPSTSFKVRGATLRVDFVTPARKRREEKPILIRRFNVAAQPLQYLDYLLDAHQPAGIVTGEGVLVNVPNPARYALHKILVSRSRSLTDHMKMEKDLQQAVQIMEVLTEDRPGELLLAWEALAHRKDRSADKVRAALPGLAKRYPSVIHRLHTMIPTIASSAKS